MWLLLIFIIALLTFFMASGSTEYHFICMQGIKYQLFYVSLHYAFAFCALQNYTK